MTFSDMRLWAFLVLVGLTQALRSNRTKRQFEADRCDPAYCQIPVSSNLVIILNIIIHILIILNIIMQTQTKHMIHIGCWITTQSDSFVLSWSVHIIILNIIIILNTYHHKHHHVSSSLASFQKSMMSVLLLK